MKEVAVNFAVTFLKDIIMGNINRNDMLELTRRMTSSREKKDSEKSESFCFWNA